MFKRNIGEEPSTIWSWMALIIALWASWFLLLQRLGGPSFWIDEMLSFNRASLLDWHSFYVALLDANHAPLYERFFLHPWLLLGDGEFWARFPGIVLAMLTISLTYRLGKQAVGTRLGILGIIFLVFSPLFYQHVREVRPYSLLALTATLSIYFWLKAVYSGSYKHWGLFTLFGAAAIYTHYYAGFVLIGISVTTLVLKLAKKIAWNRVYQTVFAYVGIAVLFLPWIPTFLMQLQSGAVSWILPLSLRSFLELPTSFFAHTLFSEVIWNGIILVTWALLLVAVVLSWHLGQRGTSLLIWLSLFFFSLTAVSLASLQKPLLVPRYFVSLTPVVALIAAFTTNWMLAKKKLFFLIIPLLLLGAGSYSVFMLTYLDRTPDWRSAANFIQEMSAPGDEIILFGGQAGSADLPLKYYLGDSWTVTANNETMENQVAVESILNDLVPAKRVWLIQSARSTPSRSLDYQPGATYGPYVFLQREVFDQRAMKPHLSVDLWLLELAQP